MTAAAQRKDAAWHARRLTGIGGSDANIIMGGDAAALIHLWQVKRQEAEPEDFSGVLPVRIGEATEELNAEFYTRATGRVITHRNQPFSCGEYPFMRCEIDGWDEELGAVFEAKHVNMMSNIDEQTAKYMPQLHHLMICTGAERAALSVFLGTMKHEIRIVEYDPIYASVLIGRERDFWQHVQDGTPPADMPGVLAPVDPETMRTVDFTGNNEWGSFAADWLANKDPAKKFEKAFEGLKKLMARDVKEAFGHGIRATRSKTGAVTIKEAK